MRKDGGPAFAGAWDMVFAENDGHGPVHKIEARSKGMSLRDYFAAAALTGFLAQYSSRRVPDVSVVAREVFRYADAMLAEREKS